MWCLRMPDLDTPHVVLLHDRTDARVMAAALNAYTSRERAAPSKYEHLKMVFGRYYGQMFEGSHMGDGRMHAEECDFDATLRWALARNIGVISIAKIQRQPMMQFVVPMTIVSPSDDSEGGVTDAMLAAFAEDFGWQLP